jgi:hypothetical protein
MTQYLESGQYLSGTPGLVMFDSYTASGNYQAFRYSLGQALMGNGIFVYTPGGNYNSPPPIMNEYKINGVAHPLGAALQGPATSPSSVYSSGVNAGSWNQGVWRRDFANGIYLVNPAGNGAKTVALGAYYWTFPGTQDPSHNNNSRVNSVTISDSDGYMLFNTQQ